MPVSGIGTRHDGVDDEQATMSEDLVSGWRKEGKGRAGKGKCACRESASKSSAWGFLTTVNCQLGGVW